jgi:hypothetical protein
MSQVSGGNKEDCQTASQADGTEIREDINEVEAEILGDTITSTIQGNVLRIGFVNINRFPASTSHPKNKQILNIINKSKISIIGMAEANWNWNKLKERDKWHNRIRDWWETQRIILAFNTKDNIITSDFQQMYYPRIWRMYIGIVRLLEK